MYIYPNRNNLLINGLLSIYSKPDTELGPKDVQVDKALSTGEAIKAMIKAKAEQNTVGLNRNVRTALTGEVISGMRL